jgi:hypothetical protein
MGKPVKVFKAGAIEAAIFENEIQTGGKNIKLHRIVLQKRYKAADGEWKSTTSFDVNDAPKVELVVKQAYAWCVCKDRRDGGEATDETPF